MVSRNFSILFYNILCFYKSLLYVNDFTKKYAITFFVSLSATEDVYIAERLFSSSLVAIVSHSAPRKLKVCHFKKGTEICNYSYTSKILAVKMNRAVSKYSNFLNKSATMTNLTKFIFQRLVVCLEESLFIHNIRDMKVLHTIRETPPNKNGLCALSIDSDHCYLAYPGHSSVGELQIFDALHLVRYSSSFFLISWRVLLTGLKIY